MATGISSYLATKWLDLLRSTTSYTGTTTYVKLHIGDPGASGTANAATEKSLQSAALGAASGGTISNTSAITWTNISGSQDATHFSLWDSNAVDGSNNPTGNFLGSGTITANAYTAGDTYTIPIGDLDLSLTVAS